MAEARRGGDQPVRAGSWQVVLDALPSVMTPDDVFGVTAVAFVDDNLYVLTAAGGRDVGDPSYDNAILRVDPRGEVSQVVNVTALNYQSPPLARLRDVRADVEGGVPFGMTAFGGRLYITDGNLETVTEVGLDGSTRRLIELPASNRVLVGLA